MTPAPLDTTAARSADGTYRGTGVVSGIAYAPAAWKQGRPDVRPSTEVVPEEGRAAEADRLTAAAEAVADRIDVRAALATGVASEVLAATAALARDRGWRRAAAKLVKSGTIAQDATTAAIDDFVIKFEKLGGLMAERTTDLKDIRDRVVAELLGLPEPGVPTPESPVVLFADDLAPADTAGLDPSVVTALVTSLGGPTSHTSIIARQLGIPCIVAADGIEAIAEGTPVLVDGASGLIRTDVPGPEATLLVEKDRARREAIRAWRGPARTRDGHEVELLANVQDGAGARVATQSQAQGVGLFRTELCFLGADVEPSVAEQAEVYGQVLTAFAGRKVVIRTLDAGSDKPLSYATLPEEENPALGVRGIRVASRDEGILTRQLDAIAAAAAGRQGTTWVMAPMVATVPEAARFAALCRARGITPGIMVEVPAVALRAEKFLEHVDFLSVGTNDLSQYTMAADRMSPFLASLTDPWQPAVLQLIAATAAAGAAGGKPVGVCGEAAAGPLLACVLVGMGVTSLSMASSAIATVGLQLSRVTLEQCREAAQAALAAVDADAARAVAGRVLQAD